MGGKNSGRRVTPDKRRVVVSVLRAPEDVAATIRAAAAAAGMTVTGYLLACARLGLGDRAETIERLRDTVAQLALELGARVGGKG